MNNNILYLKQLFSLESDDIPIEIISEKDYTGNSYGFEINGYCFYTSNEDLFYYYKIDLNHKRLNYNLETLNVFGNIEPFVLKEKRNRMLNELLNE